MRFPFIGTVLIFLATLLPAIPVALGSTQPPPVRNGILVATTTTVTASPSPASVRDTITFTANVTAADASVVNSGTVTFTVSGVVQTASVVNGSATDQINLNQGTYSMSAAYSGTTNYQTSSGATSVTVTCVYTTTTISPAYPAIQFGDVGYLFVSISPHDNYVYTQATVYDDAQYRGMVGIVQGGTGQYNFIPVRTGVHTLSAMYPDDVSGRCGSASAPVSMTVEPNGKSRVDLNGDKRADLFWRNTNSGVVGYWLLNGTSISESANIATVPLNLAVNGFGDLNGDGKTDIIWRDANNGIGCWLMDGGNIIGGGFIGTTQPDLFIAGIGDFDHDGKADILWRDGNTPGSGAVGIWLMNGATIKQGIFLGNAPHSVEVAGVGDLDGDGFDDIVWYEADNGTVGAWLIGGVFGGVIKSGGRIGQFPSTTFKIVGIGDLNGDGKADLVIRDFSLNASGGNDLYVWFLNGTTLTETELIGSVPPSLQIRAVGDIDGDGKADIIFYNPSTGDVGAWLMDGSRIKAGGYIAGAPSGWQIQ